MANINYINTGSSSNKGDGDTLRTAFNKINANFRYISSATFYGTGTFVLETATNTVLGGVKIGQGLVIDGTGLLSTVVTSTNQLLEIDGGNASTTQSTGDLDIDGGGA